MKYSVSVVIPAYNEDANIAQTVRDAAETLSSFAQPWEIIVVDDGSTDRTDAIVEELMHIYKNLRLIRHHTNSGYGAAIRNGFYNARYDYIFLFPADRQFELSQMPQFLKEAEDTDIVLGYRRNRKDSLLRRVNATIFNLAVGILFGLRYKDIDCGFKLYRRCVFDDIKLYCSGALIDTELFCKARKRGFRVKQIDVIHKPRLYGHSTGGNPKVIFYAMYELIRLWLKPHLNR